MKIKKSVSSAARRQLQMVRRKIRRGLRQHGRARRYRCRHYGLRRSLSSRPGLSARLRRGRARGNRRNRSSSDWRDALPTRKAQPPHECRAQGPPLRQIGARHRLLGHFRAIRRPCASASCWAGATAAAPRSTARSLRSPPRRWPPASGNTARGLPPLPTESRRRARNGYRAHPRAAAELRPGDRLVADANTALADARRDAGRARRERRGRVYRAALPLLRRVLSVRRRAEHPFILDETVDGIDVPAAAPMPTWRWTSSTSRSPSSEG